MQAKHPKGPYITDTTKASLRANNDRAVLRSADGRMLAQLNAGDEFSVNEYAAMTLLLRSAPDLLELALSFESICIEERDSWSGQGDEIAAGIEATWEARLANVRAVIAMATGNAITEARV